MQRQCELSYLNPSVVIAAAGDTSKQNAGDIDDDDEVPGN